MTLNVTLACSLRFPFFASQAITYIFCSRLLLKILYLLPLAIFGFESNFNQHFSVGEHETECRDCRDVLCFKDTTISVDVKDGSTIITCHCGCRHRYQKYHMQASLSVR